MRGSQAPRIQYGAAWAASAGWLGQFSGHWRLPLWCHRPGSAGSPPTTRANAGRHGRVGPAGLIPFPAQALDRLEAQFDPEAERVPTHPDCFRRKVGEDDPWLLLLGVPDRQQSATAFGVGEGGTAADPRGNRDGKRRRGRAAGGRPGRRR